MKKISTIFLQVVIVLIGIGTLVLMLWEPHLEGRNVQATLFEIYFKDPFLAYVYAASLFFFVALSRGFKVLGYIRQNETFSQRTVNALKIIKYCAMGLIVSILGVEAYLFIIRRTEDDIAGGVAISLALLFIFVVVAASSAVFERIFQHAVDIKSENDLTV